ncbi:glycosyltransferase family 2 protein [Dyadobacter arcticus]|uniref:Glycosyltransferase involved in cell wall biosynthesis n=1 Tax=Dyadobacter arcticus TaxID=1078754 RepID=A0ABX0UMV7_9BACT|nr:glycosyltransferase family 2 protein [Dyadobacter arcticus]NIJ52980.1 glycosyltransferase involved in cell wall biosynthesis [Dyadobacter arcticus]
MEAQHISIIIPVYNQASFIRRAIVSVKKQDFLDWEIVVINDGSTDNLESVLREFMDTDSRIRYYENERNEGMGYSLNKGIELASYDYIAYLPADDIFFKNHLSSLCTALDENPDAVLAYSGLRYEYYDSIQASLAKTTFEKIEDGPHFQLVQVLHRKVDETWVERAELVTDDLNFMFWGRIKSFGRFVSTNQVSAEWVSHPLQRHKIINELGSWGGIHWYKQYYKVKQRLRFKSASGHFINEFNDFKTLQYLPVVRSSGSLKILLVGELAYNAERICALEEQGHQLYGLWIGHPYFFNAVGPLPFGNVQDIPMDNWEARVKEIQPDIIYAQLNSYAVPLAHEVMQRNLGIPFVWHFKEGPFVCRQQGLWDRLIDLFQNSDGQIYINEENKVWFEQFLDSEKRNSFILDGDLPSRFYFKEEKTELLSEKDGQIHTVVSGRPFGIEPNDVKEMSKQDIHLHIYGDISHKTYKLWLTQVLNLAPKHVHLYHNCSPAQWTKVLSQYDAGWLHVFQSANQGELMKMDWMDLNLPARLTTLATAGLPMIQRDNSGNIVASQNMMKKFDTGVFFKDFEDLGQQLRDKARLRKIRENCWNNRMYFSFDYHVKDLVDFFRKTIAKKREESSVAVW